MRLRSFKKRLLEPAVCPKAWSGRFFHHRTRRARMCCLTVTVVILLCYLGADAQTPPTGTVPPGSQVQDTSAENPQTQTVSAVPQIQDPSAENARTSRVAVIAPDSQVQSPLAVNDQTSATGAFPPSSQVLDPCATPQSEDESRDDYECIVKKLKINFLIDLYGKLFSKNPHIVIGSIVPGSGFSAGIGYKSVKRYERPDEVVVYRQFDVAAKVSTRKYWELDGNLFIKKTPSDFDALPTKMNAYGVVKDMRRLDYFGIGPESRKQDRAVFHYREAVIGIDLARGVNSWIDVGGAVEVIWPHITPIADHPTVRSVARAFSEATAPGIASQPAFLHLVAVAKFHTRGETEYRRGKYEFFYHYYRDLQDNRYSFRRFEADLSHKFPFGKNELRFHGRFSSSDTSAGQVVPFYLMQTLGGSNINGAETLRGFSDYRFRDRKVVLFQADFLRNLYGPINFNLFYDTGKVAPSFSQFGSGRLRHTFGLGLAILPARGGPFLFRFWIAFGSGEGSHTYLGSGNIPGGGGGDRLVR